MTSLNNYCLLKIKENKWLEEVLLDHDPLLKNTPNLKIFSSLKELKSASATLEKNGASVHPVEWGPYPLPFFPQCSPGKIFNFLEPERTSDNFSSYTRTWQSSLF